MIIDWFTILAQSLNFLILVWLMKHFLYKPILDAIDARETKIAETIAEAAKKKVDAEKEGGEFKRKNEEFNQQREALLNKAIGEAETERERLLELARADAKALSLKQKEALKNEKLNLDQTIIHRTQQEVFAITRKVLTDLSGITLEERMIDVFIQKLQGISEGEKKEMTIASNDSTPIILRTTFELSQVLQSSLESAIKSKFGNKIQIQFETSKDLISGIELNTNGIKLAWSIEDYLKSLEKRLDEIIKTKEVQISEVKAPTESEIKIKPGKPEKSRKPAVDISETRSP